MVRCVLFRKERCRVSLTLTVHAGSQSHESPLISVTVSRDALGLVAPGAVGSDHHGAAEAGICLLHDEDASGGPDGILVAQFDAHSGTLRFILPGSVRAASVRHLRVLGAPIASVVPPWPMSVVQKLDRVIVRAAGEPFASYITTGGRRPYFWPIIGPSGASVVRGQGSADHPHHTGLGIAYGGHSEGGSVNIWSDWDEPPYGPGGRMVHRGFRRVISGPVYAEVVHDLTYVDTFGDPFCEETRTHRFWWASEAARYIDTTSEVRWLRDRGTSPFLVALRLPSEMDIPNIGSMTNDSGTPVPPAPGAERAYPAMWVDGSGPSGEPPYPPPAGAPEVLVDQPGARPYREGPGTGPWHGVAIFDHPSNHGFPHQAGKYAGSMGTGGSGTGQITLAFYPPEGASEGAFTFGTRTYVHRGDAIDGRVDAQAASFRHPPEVVVGS